MYSTFFILLSFLVICLCYGRAFNQGERYEEPRLIGNSLEFERPRCVPSVLNCYKHFRYHCNPTSKSSYCGDCWKNYKEVNGRCINKEDLYEPERKIEEIAKSVLEPVPVKDSTVEKNVKVDQKKLPEGHEPSGEKQPAANTTTPKTGPAPHPSSPAHHKQGPPGEANAPGYGQGFIFIMLVAGCSLAGLVGLILAGVCWYKIRKSSKAASEVDYPAYGVTGPQGREHVISPGDRKLAQSAQMYHYQHQKQQMIAMEKANGDMKHDGSEEDSDEENEEGDYTVYECPGLAPTGEMEVKNPLFSEDVTPTPGDKDKEKGNE
ncbi:neural proliferation differentiation and control protein 1 [Lingula anatina]|uniref:Neural proliferation differentiation and control protein 1 n=1 Tax=Lingula anatina TaxID=7574 RepID=A0A1S3K7P7_LINAN|nr:neural proliferation differentiation and control protein 1 [Lingula anatina]|eukprot:XP_013418648.1 neural proliferation differentiation and control protein 1 [Lingula anatina]